MFIKENWWDILAGARRELVAFLLLFLSLQPAVNGAPKIERNLGPFPPDRARWKAMVNLFVYQLNQSECSYFQETRQSGAH
jgi:hypothetical protein